MATTVCVLLVTQDSFVRFVSWKLHGTWGNVEHSEHKAGLYIYVSLLQNGSQAVASYSSVCY